MQDLVSHGMKSDVSRCRPVVLRLSDFLPHCDLSYIGLITGCEVDMISKLIIGGELLPIYEYIMINF